MTRRNKFWYCPSFKFWLETAAVKKIFDLPLYRHLENNVNKLASPTINKLVQQFGHHTRLILSFNALSQKFESFLVNNFDLWLAIIPDLAYVVFFIV